MSRAVGRSYADFFPTAPSVLQEKKKLARSRPKTGEDLKAEPAGRDSQPSSLPASDIHTRRERQETDTRPTLENGIEHADRYSPNRDAGDLLNGVGSASSLTSTTSSIFSAAGLPVTSSIHNGAAVMSSELTPMTNDESSPRELSPTLRSQNDKHAKHVNGFSYSPDQQDPPIITLESITPLPTPCHAQKQPRPAPGLPKGCKAVYDPELDPKLPMKDRRKVKVKYADFSDEDIVVPSSDPRLAIPGYRSGNFELRKLSGEAKLWKYKARPAPYSIKPYQWDPAISVGSGPPTSVVVIGFDPFTPESQLRALFGSFGDIAVVDNKTDPNTGTFLGVCLIRYRDSHPHRGTPTSAVAAALRAEKEGNKQRVGQNVVRVERDQAGRKCRRYVERLAQKNVERQAKERIAQNDWQPPPPPPPQPTEAGPIGTPPPNAPTAPSGKSRFKPPPEGPRLSAIAKPFSLVEEEPVLPKIKRKPYIFIANEHVPVMPTTIPHLQKRFKMYHWTEIRCDNSGYFVIFEDSKRGEDEAKRCYTDMDNQAMFTYQMVMECQQYGNPNYERTPSPERIIVEARRKEQEEQIRLDEALDLEEEKRDRALHLDPVKAALEQLRVELRERIASDVKSRISAPALYDYLDPAKHVAKRRKLGIADPNELQRAPAFLAVKEETATARANSNKSTPSKDFRKDLLSGRLGTRTPREEYPKTTVNNAFIDERRQRRPQRKIDVRSLHQRLQEMYGGGDESDDEQATVLTRSESQEQDSRPLSRMSSVAPIVDRESEFTTTPKKRKRLDRDETPQMEETLNDQAVAETGVEYAQREPEDMSIQELTSVLDSLPRTSKLHKRAKAELRLRQTAREDDRLFNIDTKEIQDGEPMVLDAGLVNELTIPPVIESTELPDQPKAKLLAKKTKSKKKSKKQIFLEREAAKQEALLQGLPAVEEVEELEVEQEEAVDEVMEDEEPRAEVEWGLSTEAPRRTVQDDDAVVLDVDGWQNVIKDDEDLMFLRQALANEQQADLGEVNTWALRQKEVKSMNTSGAQGLLRTELQVGGYYVPNATGSARTEGSKKILESEKSKYLPHRIRVAKAREAREAQVADEKIKPLAAAEAARLAKLASTANSRSTRVNNRTHIKDINIVKQLATDGQQGDAIRFNQLKKRKKLVKFDRSAIHGWGLYAEENITMNEMIIEYVGEKVRQAVANVREIRYDRQGMGSSYLFRIDEDSVVDATKKGGIARFINHSCSPNCTAKIIRVEGTKRIVIYALKDIARNQELTYDYKFDREMDNQDRIPCLCGSDVCKGFLN